MSMNTLWAKELEELYKKVGENLVSIQKEYPQSQQKIYLVLDQVDKLYNLSLKKGEKNKRLKTLLKEKEHENQALNKHISTLKKGLSETTNKLDVTSKNLEQERSLVTTLIQENKVLATAQQESNKKQVVAAQQQKKNVLMAETALPANNKVQQPLEQELDALQNLNLNSACEPKSPR